MMIKTNQVILLGIFLTCNVLWVFCDQTNEETHPYYEYIQIFKSIPALFEYLLNALEERPEILEKNDVTTFKRNIEGSETEECESADYERKNNKRDIDCNTPLSQDEYKHKGKRNARDAKDISHTATTKSYEYGNSNIIMQALEETESNKVIYKRNPKSINENLENSIQTDAYILKRQFNGPAKRYFGAKLDENSRYAQLLDYGDAFLGVEHLFGLDLNPKDIEEKILTAEQLLQEHNSKRGKGE